MWHLVEGVPLPDPVGGHPALDFCNTRAGWHTGAPKEYLTSATALALWCRDSGLLAERDAAPLVERTRAADPEAHDVLSRALSLREALYPTLLGQGTAEQWGVLAREAARARTASALVPGEPGQPARWVSSRPFRLAVLVHVVADAAESLLVTPTASAVRACPGAGCGWVFLDPRRRRRWCSMAVCGNRAKARRHAERRARVLHPGLVALGAPLQVAEVDGEGGQGGVDDEVDAVVHAPGQAVPDAEVPGGRCGEHGGHLLAHYVTG